MRIVGNDPELSRQIMATASGAISAAGKPLVVNTDGTVRFAGSFSVSNTEAVTTAFAEVGSGHDVGGGQSVIYDTNAQRFVLNFRDGDNSNYGTSIVIEIDSSNFSLSYGTPVVFHSAASQAYQSCFDSSNNKVVIVYKGNSDSDGRAIVGTVDNSDNSISFGTVAKFNSTNNCTEPHTCFDSTNNKVIVTWQNNSNSSYGTAAVGTVSGTDISFGTVAVFESASTTAPKPVHDVGANKIVIQYVDVGNSYYGTGIVGTVSGTDISFGSAVVYNSSTEYGIGQPVYDSTNNKTVFVYQDYGDTEKGKARVVSISGTTPSYGTEVTFESQKANPISATFDSNIGKVAIGYYDETPTNMRHITGTVSGTDISFGSELDITSDNGQPSAGAAAFDPNTGKVLYVARNVADSDKPYATVVQVGGTSTTTPLTSENFIGTSAHSAADGAKVLVNTQGAVDENIPQIAQAAGFGSVVQYDSSNLGYGDSNALAFDSNSNKVVLIYRDDGNSNYGTALVGTIDTSDDSISWGSATVFVSAAIGGTSLTFDSSNNKVVGFFFDIGDSNQMKSTVGTVSGTSISFGSVADVSTAGTANAAATFDTSSNKVVVAFTDSNNSGYGTARVGTVSGTSISFGTAVVFTSAEATLKADSITFDSSNNRVVIAYTLSSGTNRGNAIVGTVSGTDISFGTQVAFNANFSAHQTATFDTSNNKVVIAFQDSSNSDQGTAVVGTVDPSDNSISFGSEAIFNAAGTDTISSTFDSTSNTVLIAYRDAGDSSDGVVIVGTVSGTSISFGSEIKYSTGTAYRNRIIYDSNANRAVVIYSEGDQSNRGDSNVYRPAANIDLIAGQTYFVQTDGSLSETADSPSVTAGTALSATKLLVKG